MNDINTLLPHIKLRFNMEHPSDEESYLLGYECALTEVSEESNPFRAGSQAALQWQEGWWAGMYGEKPLFDPALFAKDEFDEDEFEEFSANERDYSSSKHRFLYLVFEISGAIAASAIVGYQLFELVA